MDNFQIKLPVLSAKQFIPQLVTKLGLQSPDLMEKVAYRVLARLENSNLGPQINNPKNLATISIYLTYNILQKAKKLNVSITQRDFSKAVGISETTLRKYKQIFQQAVSVNY